jgi:hypothetical protein
MYELEGTLLQACSCRPPCPTWLGEDPDGGECFGLYAYLIDAGVIQGVDVSGLTVLNVIHMPGNALIPKSWEMVTLIDDQASTAQYSVLVDAFSGALGGPLGEIAGLVAKVLAAVPAPITTRIADGSGLIQVPGRVSAAVEPYRGANGAIPTIISPVLGALHGATAKVGRAPRNRVSFPEHGLKWEFEGRGAIQADWAVAHRDAAIVPGTQLARA